MWERKGGKKKGQATFLTSFFGLRCSCQRHFGWEKSSLSPFTFQRVTVTWLAEAVQLLTSLLSDTTLKSSEQATKKNVPDCTLAGTVTVTVPVDVAPDARPGTARLPFRRISLVLFCVLTDR